MQLSTLVPRGRVRGLTGRSTGGATAGRLARVAQCAYPPPRGQGSLSRPPGYLYVSLRNIMLRAAAHEDVDAVVRVLLESRSRFLPFAPSPHTDRDVRNWVRSALIPSGGVVVYESDREVVAVLSTSVDAEAS